MALQVLPSFELRHTRYVPANIVDARFESNVSGPMAKLARSPSPAQGPVTSTSKTYWSKRSRFCMKTEVVKARSGLPGS